MCKPPHSSIYGLNKKSKITRIESINITFIETGQAVFENNRL